METPKNKLLEFSFKREPLWMWLGSIVPAVAGIIILLLVALIYKLTH